MRKKTLKGFRSLNEANEQHKEPSITTNLQAAQQPLNECLHANKNKVMSESKEILTRSKKKKVSNGSVIYD